MFNKWSKIFISIFAVTALVVFLGHNYVNYVERKQVAVTIVKSPKKTLFFYRDDCKDCQSIFHHVYWKNFLNQNVTFINMNQAQNRKYIAQYNLTAVPTFVNGAKRYTGTNVNKIDDLLGE